MKTFEYTINDELGIHARPAGMLVKEAGKYACSVTISKGEKSASAKKIFGVMGLGVKPGETIIITCDGEDEEAAISAIAALLQKEL
jgi:phosphocarrier protein